MQRILDCAGRPLDLREPRVMGILNVTPDSFSDGGNFFSVSRALARARDMVAEGAAIVDVGGESTRPGAQPVSVQEELDRVVPVIEAIHGQLEVPISVDTSKPEVMRAAVAAGAGLINDVRALRLPSAIETAAGLGVPVCLMHLQGEPGTMQQQPHYDDVVAEVIAFLAGRVEACVAGGILRERLVLDPGFGFGKNLEHNLRLLRGLPALRSLGLPLLVGLSRKSMIGALLQVPAEERIHGSIAAATIAAWLGASIIRVHDVGATVQALKICHAVSQAGYEKE
jgi:dihydropteroate synthase